jgi:hypothetical protein
MRLAAIALIHLVLLNGCRVNDPHATRLGEPSTASYRIDGGFIAYWNNMMARPESEWCDVLGSMRAVGMETVVVQRLV